MMDVWITWLQGFASGVSVAVLAFIIGLRRGRR